MMSKVLIFCSFSGTRRGCRQSILKPQQAGFPRSAVVASMTSVTAHQSYPGPREVSHRLFSMALQTTTPVKSLESASLKSTLASQSR